MKKILTKVGVIAGASIIGGAIGFATGAILRNIAEKKAEEEMDELYEAFYDEIKKVLFEEDKDITEEDK